jgi:hypothetical protein
MHWVRLALAMSVAVSACRGDHAQEAPAEQAVREAVQQAVQEAPPPFVPGIAPGSVGLCGVPLIDSDGIGTIRIGMSADSVQSRCKVLRDTTQPDNEGMAERVLMVDIGGDSVAVEVDSGRVWRIDVRTPRLRTADSLGVGTPIASLLALEGGVQGLAGEGSLFLLAQARCGLSFELSARATGGDWQRPQLRTLPPTTRVKRVLVIGCPAG